MAKILKIPKAKGEREIASGPFWSVRAEKTDSGDDAGHLYLYGEIASESWWGDEVTPKMFRDDLNALGEVETLTVHIFSNGGDVFAGFAIYSQLKQFDAKVIVYIEGIAASMATVVAMAGDEVYISQVAMMLIHNPMFILWGYYNEGDLTKMVADLQKLREPIIAAYMDKTGESHDDVVSMMDGEDGSGTWFTADEAIDASLADGYIPEEEALGAVACLGGDIYAKGTVAIDLSMYKDAPELHIPERRKPMGANDKNARNKTNPKAGAKGEAVDEKITVTCPECDAEFEVEIDDDAEGTVEITCPECDATLEYDVESGEVSAAESSESDDDPEDVQDDDAAAEEGEVAKAVAKALKADRERITSLDQLADIHPEQSKIVEDAKRDGTSYAIACKKVMDAVQGSKAGGKSKFIAGMKKDGEKTGKVGAAPNSGAEGQTSKVQQGIADSVALFQNN